MPEACDRGRLGGGPGDNDLVPVGVLGADSVSAVGTRLDRIRVTFLWLAGGGEDEVRLAADADRGGGAGVFPGGGLAPVIPGEAVCARDGGGGPGGLLGSSAADCFRYQSK